METFLFLWVFFNANTFLLVVSSNPLLSSKQTFKTVFRRDPSIRRDQISQHDSWFWCDPFATTYVLSTWYLAILSAIATATATAARAAATAIAIAYQYSLSLDVIVFQNLDQSLLVLNHSNSEWYKFSQYTVDNESWRRHDNTSCTQLYYRLYQATNQFTALLEKSYRIGSINTSSLLYREILKNWRNGSWHIRKIFESHLMESLYKINTDTCNQQFPSSCLKLEHQQSKFHLLINFNTIKSYPNDRDIDFFYSFISSSYPLYFKILYYYFRFYRSLAITSEGVL